MRTRSRRGLGKKLLWRLLKFLSAARATEVVALFAVIYFRFCLFGVNIHAANRIAFHVSHLASFSLVGAGLAPPSLPSPQMLVNQLQQLVVHRRRLLAFAAADRLHLALLQVILHPVSSHAS